MNALSPSRLIISLVFAALAGASAPAHAQSIKANPRAVVELFTSQGCSSCPPADELLTTLDQNDNVLALAYHVDYWDYIGWADTFAKPEFSALQRAYAQCWNKDRVFTPQMIINGRSGVVGSRRDEVHDGIASASLPLAMVLDSTSGLVNISLPPAADHPASTLWLVTFNGSEEVSIERGENSGHNITYTQIVTSRQALGMWSPEKGLDLTLKLADVLDRKSDGLALIVQEDRDGLPGPIIAAASIEL